MPSWKKVITSGSNAAFNSLTVSSTITGSISGSLTGSLSGSTTVGNNLITLPNPGAVTYLRVNADNTITSRTPSQVLTDLGVASTIVLARDFNTYTVSNTTVETIAWSSSIAANTLQVNDFIEFNSQFNTNTPNSVQINYRLYINTTNSLVGATQIAYFSNSVGTGNAGLQRNIYVTAIGSSGNFKILNKDLSSTTSYGISSIAISNIPINTTIPQYLLISINMGNNTSTSSVQAVMATITR